MAKSFQDIMAETRKAIREISLESLRDRLEAGESFTLLDVREGEEFRAGHIPGAVNVPRAHLESKAEATIADRDAPVIVYCAGGVRSALAAKTLAEMGYTNVESANPGFVQWKDRRYPMVVPRVLTADQRDRYSRHLLLPEVGEKGQAKLLDAKVLCLGAGGLGSPAALYLAAAGIGTIGLVDPDVVDASNLQRQVLHNTSRVGKPKVDSAEETLKGLNPDVRVVKFQERLTSENVDRIFDGFDVIIDGCDNFPTRYLVNDASVMKRKHLPLRGAGHDLRPVRRSVLPVFVSRAPAGGARAVVPGGRRARRSPRDHRRHPGYGGDQAGARRRQAARRAAAHLRLAGHALSRAQAAPRRRLPDVRQGPDDHVVH